LTVTRTRGRLPGVRFEAQPRAPRDVLPRMDVAVFVGFAAAGPINRPVAVESDAHFADVFGEGAPLVWDGRRGERVRAYLAPAVRAFFRNGGLRCWVVRVAGGAARYNYLPVPGLVRLRRDGTLAPAYARARARGSWSDALRAGAALSSLPVAATRFDAETPNDFDLELSRRGDVVAGDLLRFTFNDEGYVLFVVVGSVNALEPASPTDDAAAQRRTRVRVVARSALWFKMPAPPSDADEGEAVVYAPDVRRRAHARVPAGVVWSTAEEVALDLELPSESAPPPGTFVRAEFAGEQLWLLVRESSVADGASPTGTVVRAKGQALYTLKGSAPSPAPSGTPFVERLRFELSVARGAADPVRLGDMAFAPDHARFWGALPTDEEFYGDTLTPFEARDPQTRARRADFETKYAALWREVSPPRFPLAGRHKLDAGDVYLPLLMPALSDAFLRPVAQPATALERDGLAQFDETLFLDPQLRSADTETLLSEADYIRYQSPTPRRLRGIHAALEIEEATIISVPDEVHIGWERQPTESVEPSASDPVPHPEWWHSLPCSPTPEAPPRATEPPRANFLDCDLRVVARPTLSADAPDPAGTFTLTWGVDADGADGDETGYVLEEATDPNWTDSVRIYEGARTRLTLYGRGTGDYFYRVRAQAGRSSSEWSNGVVARVAPPGVWRARRADDYTADTLLGVQRALLRACAARGDLFAVLSLPSHYREDDARAHAAALTLQIRPTTDVKTLSAVVPPLSSAERRALSYGALYHPWLAAREENALTQLSVTPPAGAVCGVMAARAVTRGAWVAPANEPLRGVVALVPALLRRRLLDLQDAQVNVVRNEPRGFLVLDAETLSDDPALRQINVRRLLSLLRRLALRLGANYVFEPNDDSFRRLVERGFEQMLGQMFERGAFAGATPAAAFRVNAGSPPNTPQGTDNGRFIVELAVAPSRPLAFLTIRMMRTGDGEVAVEER
jgi:hypothetical protein